MKFPKCRTCGKEHALGGCPEFQMPDKLINSMPEPALRKGHEVSRGAGRKEQPPTIVTVDPSSSKDFGAKVIGKVMEDGRIEILSIVHSKSQFNKTEYHRNYMRDKATIKRLGLSCTVAAYRKSKESER